jgi:SAM-dependent methyltransferase
MFFERAALEQASGELTARHRASRFHRSGVVFDLGCGLGGDALELAARARVVAADRDPLRLELLRSNARALGVGDRIAPVRADLRRTCWRFPAGATAFFDPSRRQAHRRLRSVRAYDPPLSVVDGWRRQVRGISVKLSPALDLAEVRSLGGEIEFVSVRAELKEAVLWLGEFETCRRRATILPGAHTITGGDDEPPPALGALAPYLYEPDPAVLRAGLVRHLGRILGAWQVDPNLGFLSSDRPLATPFARGFQVLEVIPFSLKRLQAVLRGMDVGNVTLKKRGSAVDTEDLRGRLRLTGSGEATVLLTRLRGEPLALIVRRQQDASEADAGT